MTIIEIGAAIMKGNEVLSTFQTFVDPGTGPCSRQIVDLTGINDADACRAAGYFRGNAEIPGILSATAPCARTMRILTSAS